ncbi:hypothetical protein CF15_05790 [Pyrodictium occultum]|uniref:Uncharacterized protein n=1 Tax=Pyrodictium occultum TaxID=2309 RepID=A0A0V8RW35_PYROC|nr:hypothetical protein [Pyrodictium occultum]KSW12261.1 hypothetical protein CF15_05790 [Pyrodictium occultum]
MEYRVEIEFGSDGAKRIRYYYRCPRCGYRLPDMTIIVRPGSNGGMVIETEEYRERRLAASRVEARAARG